MPRRRLMSGSLRMRRGGANATETRGCTAGARLPHPPPSPPHPPTAELCWASVPLVGTRAGEDGRRRWTLKQAPRGPGSSCRHLRSPRIVLPRPSWPRSRPLPCPDGLGRPSLQQARTMAPVVGQLPSATFSRDLVTLNRGCEEVPADSARCPLANEGPLERALTLVSRQEPPPRGTTRRGWKR